MRKPADLTRQELLTIVTQLQQAFYLDCDAENQLIWDPDKSWQAADFCDALASLLVDLELAPEILMEAGNSPA